MKLKNILILSILSILFISCSSGGGGGGSTPATILTGTFVDAPVKGLKYTTATQSGYTDSSGGFKYVAGEEVEFFLGNLSFGKKSAASLMTPYTLAGDTDIDAPSSKAKAMARLLQSLDRDTSADTIDVESFKSLDMGAFSLSINSQADYQTILNKANDIAPGTYTLVSESTAADTMKAYVKSAQAPSKEYGFGAVWMNGKTYYVVRKSTKSSESNTWKIYTTTFTKTSGSSGTIATGINYSITSSGNLAITGQDEGSGIQYYFIDEVKTDYFITCSKNSLVGSTTTDEATTKLNCTDKNFFFFTDETKANQFYNEKVAGS